VSERALSPTGSLRGVGTPYDVIALDTPNRANERLIAHLNVQVRFRLSHLLFSQLSYSFT
jgi:hypothetical protein